MTGEPPGSRPSSTTPPPRPGGAGAAREHPRPPVRAPSRLAVWLDQRTGYSTIVKLVTDEPISGGPRWWYVFGSVLAFLLALEVATGVLLAAFYDPSATGAWASTVFIQDTLSLGWFVRGLHSFGSTALIVVAVIHAWQVVLFGAYRAPREMTWLSGVALMGLLLLFALSGYGLPWDEPGYAAKQVDLMLTGSAPLIGPTLQKVLQGGDSMGNYTVTHLNAAHTYLLPAAAGALLVAHVLLVKRHGLTPRWGMTEVALARATRPYWPFQAALDVVACAAAFALLAGAVRATHGAALGGPADPTGNFPARPEWYMLPLYQLRKVFEGPLEMLVVVASPGIAALVVGALPWIDRSRDRAPGRRKLVLIGAAVATAGFGALGYWPVRVDEGDAAFQQLRAEASDRAALARSLARGGVPPEGGLAVYKNDPEFRARELWSDRCARCHSFTGPGLAGSAGASGVVSGLSGDFAISTGKAPPRENHDITGEGGAARDETRVPPGRGKEGPDLKGYGSRAWIAGFLRNPDAPGYMGGAHIDHGMKPVGGTIDEIAALTELVYAETGARDVDRALVERARPLLSDKDCDSCHEFDGTTANSGPNLKGYGTLAHVVDVIGDAGDERLYGAKNKMPRFGNKLSPDEISELARFVLAEAGRRR
jgi:ubiquinol-cytochrome c reductase cytochrome b subunit